MASTILKNFKEKIESADNPAEYERLAEKLWEKMNREGIKISKAQAFHFVLQIGQSAVKPLVASRKGLTDEEVI